MIKQTSQSGQEYDNVRELMQYQFDEIPANEPIFTTNADGLFEGYLASFPQAERQFHNCNTCRHFIERFGGLVRITPQGAIVSAVWPEIPIESTYGNGLDNMRKVVKRAGVTGVFLSKDPMLGTPVTDRKGYWTHFGLRLPEARIYRGRVLTAGQAMAVKVEDFKNVLRALQEFPPALVDKALTLLKSDSLYRSEKVLGAAQWLADLHSACETSNRSNAVWRAIATAPEGFCHPRSSMIGTLLEDLAAGKSFEVVSAAFRAKMSPLTYQRPQAAPAANAIKQAEALVEKLGIARSLERRYARLDELLALWTPTAETMTPTGVFGHLVPKDQSPTTELDVPAQIITWEKFRANVLPNALLLEALIPQASDRFAAIVTATNADAPPILAWDRESNRNPFSWYYATGIDAEIRRRVLSAGGQHENVDIRASLIWNNRNDLDIHCITPFGRHIYFGNKREDDGWLDVDMNVRGETTEPVENIRWQKGTARSGRYQFFVENYAYHELSRYPTPFRVELEVNGDIFTVDTTTSGIHGMSRVVVADFTYARDVKLNGIVMDRRATAQPAHQDVQKWGVTPGRFVKVNAVVESPNMWISPPTNHGRHMFFVLNGCKDTTSGVGRGFFPEMLTSELREARATLEAYTALATISGQETADACGLGMSDQAPWDLFVRVKLKGGVVATYKIDRWD